MSKDTIYRETEIMNAYHEGVRKGIAEAYEAYGAGKESK